jgi:hypothetical protein
METQTYGIHQSTYDAVFQHPIPRNLQWRDVRSMLLSIADFAESGGESMKFTRNGKTLIIHPPRRKDFSDVAELMRLRHFLDESAAPVRPPVAAGVHLLVVIDHRLARVYKTEFHGSVPERIIPYDAAGAGRHLHHVEHHRDGKRRPEDQDFYAAVATSCKGAEQILLFGSGTGASSAMDGLVAELKRHHREIADRVIGSVVVDERHLTEDQLLARARQFYTNASVRDANAVTSPSRHPMSGDGPTPGRDAASAQSNEA